MTSIHAASQHFQFQPVAKAKPAMPVMQAATFSETGARAVQGSASPVNMVALQAQMLAQSDDPSTTAAMLAEETTAAAPTYDFSNMTRGEIAEAGKQLFKEGKITLDELFRFDHPDGKLRVDLSGTETNLDPNDRIDFIGHTREAIYNMEQTGDDKRADSGYKMMVDLLAKLKELSA